ncbi:MAG: rod shape-determining protein MreD [Bacteroidetes bacterium HGW-Bacteroidetes-6]|jgi:hypothetical protein|nr:MAG: rod shape-determining protein MreD [Bacteroidetes bacterium HGW-Bacteroidetes-6]
MNKLIVSNIIRFFAVMLLQVLVFNYMNLFGFINPFVYLFFILLLPFETPAWLLLVLAFFTGFSVDMFVNTGGIHAAATLAVGFARPILLRTLVSKREFETGIKPGVADLGWKWFVSYAGISILIHSFIVFYLDALRISHFLETLRVALYQAAATFFFIVLIEFVVNIRKR